jgi:hypothetical protein
MTATPERPTKTPSCSIASATGTEAKIDSVGRKLIDVPGYTFRIFVTSRGEAPEQIWRDYHRRADMENRIAELKHGERMTSA